MPSPDDSSVTKEYEVVGVVNDFHTRSLRNRIQPTLFMPSSSVYNILYIRVVSGQEWETIRRITDILSGIDTTLADVRLTPVSELYDRLNQSEQTGLKLFSVLATVCLLISMSYWLQGYAYRTNIPWWLPAGVITGVVAVVLFTVLGQVLKAANSNPAEVIKSE
jgi:hypothetical protein